MYTIYDNRLLERQLDREEEEAEAQVDVYNIQQQIEREIVRQRDVFNIQQQIDREILRQRGGGGRHRQMYTTDNNIQIERQSDREMYTANDNRLMERYLDREEEEEVGTGRCIHQQQQIDREIVRQRGGG